MQTIPVPTPPGPQVLEQTYITPSDLEQTYIIPSVRPSAPTVFQDWKPKRLLLNQIKILEFKGSDKSIQPNSNLY